MKPSGGVFPLAGLVVVSPSRGELVVLASIVEVTIGSEVVSDEEVVLSVNVLDVVAEN